MIYFFKATTILTYNMMFLKLKSEQVNSYNAVAILKPKR